MSDHADLIEYPFAAAGLAASASRSALDTVCTSVNGGDVSQSLDALASLCVLSKRAEECMLTACDAHRRGDTELSATEWIEALVLMDRMASQSCGAGTPGDSAGHELSCEAEVIPFDQQKSGQIA